jgi:HD superfamily phosphodiesterase
MDPPERVRRYSAWLASTMAGRDASHGMEHFERVRVAALELAAKTRPLAEQDRLILELAALSHDVLDHKYDGGNHLSLRTSMEDALGSLAGLSAEQVRVVCLIADNVSLSKEISGGMEHAKLLESGCAEIRDLVSDADKLDALGLGGLKRLAQYQTHALLKSGQGTSTLTSDFLRKVATDHLLHRADYLKTEAARAEGERLLRETRALMNSDAALERIIEGAVSSVGTSGE